MNVKPPSTRVVAAFGTAAKLLPENPEQPA
jgi:hypothetical protein